MPVRRLLTLTQRFLVVGALFCVILGFLMVVTRDYCLDTYFAEIIGCKNTAYDVAIYAMNLVGALLMTGLMFFVNRFPRIVGVLAVVLGLILLWVGDMGSFFGGLFALMAGLLNLASLL